MASLLNFFSWSQPAASAQAAEQPGVASVSVGPTPAESSEDAFVLIDTPMLASTPSNSTPSHTRASSMIDSWSPIDASEPLKLASPVSALSSARSCRLYGAAHKPPRLHPSSLSTIPGSPTADGATATPSGTKRSFAEIIKSSTPPSSDPSSVRLAYAQSADLSVAEQMLAKIEQLEKLKQGSAASHYLDHPMTDDIESAIDSIQYASPPLRPVVPLTREQTRLYDEQTSWTLNVDEPNSKRAKRTASPTTIVLSKAETQAKLANKKGKSKPAARQETKAIMRARGSKLDTEETHI